VVVSGWRAVSCILLLVGLADGTRRDRREPTDATWRGGYLVLAADFHVHAFLGDGVLWPWDVVREARRRGLGAIAVTNHNQVFAAKIARWFSRRFDGPVVLVGEEITAPRFHVIAVGIETTVDDVHRQGGLAIAAHPTRGYWPGFDDEALRALDGTEVMHTGAFASRQRGDQLRAFYARARALNPRLAAIGSSDHHAFGALGVSRTYVFVRERSREGVLEALRAGRTVVLDAEGTAHGDESLARVLASDPPKARSDTERARADRLAALCGWLGLAGLLFGGSARGRRTGAGAGS
jgi:PHP domain-containing protein